MIDYRKPRRRPVWVTVGLAGLPSRAWAWAFFWFSVLTAVACGVLGVLFTPIAWLGTLFLLAAGWYWGCIRWVDRHDQW
jgi:hypothetical protein